ncbi:hypothetical protein [Sinorhizobium fredii]|uniref:hypothetical protein n=1 Tax=Rhizobium fredii TaxID=380 RepID=UPI00339517AE
MKAFVSKVSAFAHEEDGVALTEYLILLGLLVGGVVATVSTAGDNLNTAWSGWATWFTGAGLVAPAPPA